ncbi:MAG: serine O-acetyltransferase [Desulfovibrio sp.]|jgi:serine O-acetyltransferase|nr:serine O-acetyltransferase [Desulfovibrio sp.]
MDKFDSTQPAAHRCLDRVVERLCHPDSLNAVWHNSAEGAAMPSRDELREIMNRLAVAIFPGYFGQAQVRLDSLRYHLAANLDSVYQKLREQILRGFCFTCEKQHAVCAPRDSQSKNAALAFMDTLPEIRRLLAGDARAAYEGDPAAQSPEEAVFCYPSLRAMLHHRIAHELHTLDVPMIPRMISEMAHAHTGIDIHPGAAIGEEFFIDHGTGVVIGETCVIGQNCRLYQGVTLGALSFPKKPDGTLIKGISRHPILEDNVTIYAGATILGRVTIGRGAVVGGNMWITEDVPAGARISQEKPYA